MSASRRQACIRWIWYVGIMRFQITGNSTVSSIHFRWLPQTNRSIPVFLVIWYGCQLATRRLTWSSSSNMESITVQYIHTQSMHCDLRTILSWLSYRVFLCKFTRLWIIVNNTPQNIDELDHVYYIQKNMHIARHISQTLFKIFHPIMRWCILLKTSYKHDFQIIFFDKYTNFWSYLLPS